MNDHDYAWLIVTGCQLLMLWYANRVAKQAMDITDKALEHAKWAFAQLEERMEQEEP